MGVDPAAFGKVDRTPIAGQSRAAALEGIAHGGVIMNRGYAASAGLHVGDRVPLRGPAGSRPAPVVGILKTTTSFSGEMMQMSLATMRAVYEIQSQISQQFNFFNAIIVIAVVVSLLGVINTLAMSVIERTREIGVLRALGASRWLVRATMLDESLLITSAGAIAGIAVGLLIAYVWVSALDSVIPGIAFPHAIRLDGRGSRGRDPARGDRGSSPRQAAARLKPVEALSYESR